MNELAVIYSALADPTRLRLLHLMKDGEICVCFLQGVLQTNQPKVSRHLAYLRNAGVVDARREGKWMYYSLKQQAGGLDPVVAQALERMNSESSIQKDGKRLKEICCCPSDFGISSPAGPIPASAASKGTANKQKSKQRRSGS